MKIIETGKYKIKQAAFEGEVYTPENEDVWLGTLGKERKSPIPHKRHPSTNKNRARYRPSVIDKVPFDALPQAQLDEHKRNQVFDEESEGRNKYDRRRMDSEAETLRRAGIVKEWLNWIPNKYVRERLREIFVKAWKEGREGAGLMGELYHASQGKESALKSLQQWIKEEIPPFEPGKIINPNFN